MLIRIKTKKEKKKDRKEKKIDENQGKWDFGDFYRVYKTHFLQLILLEMRCYS